jgi:hypothetical protein
MKKLNLFIAGVFSLFLLQGLKAQTKTGADYFTGKWSLLVKGTPNGDAKLFAVLEKRDTIMTGVIQDSTGLEMTKITKVDLKEKQVTVYFTAQGYDVYMTMDIKDDDHVTGSMMGMFDTDGERVKKSNMK